MGSVEWVGRDGVIHSGEGCGIASDYEVIECAACQFKHVVPIPTEDFLHHYYKEKFVGNRPEGFYAGVESSYSWNKIFYDERYDLFEERIDHESRSILDIGSGLGFFLKTGKDRGWNVVGIEPSIDSFEFSKRHGVDIRNEYLNSENFTGFGQYDVVHLHDVIEHLPDPIEILRLVKKMLRPGGLICIVSPNDYNPLQEAYVCNSHNRKWWISPPEHINYFDFSSIERILKNTGYRVVEKTATFPLELFLMMGDEYVGDRGLGKIVHSKRVAFEEGMFQSGFDGVRRDLYKKFAEIGVGREFVVIATVDK